MARFEPHASAALAEVVSDATTVLLTGPTGTDQVTAAALSVLSSPTPAENHVHWVTMLRSPQAVARTWTEQAADAPASLRVVEVGQTRRRLGEHTADLPSSTAHVESPSDLTTLGIRLSEGPTSPTAAGPTDGPHRVWFESLSTLLQYVSPAAAFRFLHTLRGRLAGTETTVCCHLDPALHDPRTVRTFLSVCDARLIVDADELVVRRR